MGGSQSSSAGAGAMVGTSSLGAPGSPAMGATLSSMGRTHSVGDRAAEAAAVATGHAANYVQDGAAYFGLEHKTFKFESTAKAVMKLHGIESWSSRSLIAERLRVQLELARRSPLRFIKVDKALEFIETQLECQQSGSLLSLWKRKGVISASREEFVDICWNMLLTVKDYQNKSIRVVKQDREDLFSIFDSMDFDGDGTIGNGEFAGLCSIFFRGTTEECLGAVFEVLDQDDSGKLTLWEVEEYLRPYVKALSPDSAVALGPVLLRRTTEELFRSLDIDHNGEVSREELLEWTRRGRSVIDALVDIIDVEVYKLWMEADKERRRRSAAGAGAAAAVAAAAALGSWASAAIWKEADGSEAASTAADGMTPNLSYCSSTAAAAAADSIAAVEGRRCNPWSQVPPPPPPPLRPRSSSPGLPPPPPTQQPRSSSPGLPPFVSNGGGLRTGTPPLCSSPSGAPPASSLFAAVSAAGAPRGRSSEGYVAAAPPRGLY